MTVEEVWSSPGTIALQTVGCKLNQAETDSLARKFLDAGYHVVPPTDAADIYLLNTCTVTHIADHKCRKLLRAAHRRNPSSLTVVAGCYAERAPAEIAGIEGIDLIVSGRDKERIVETVVDKTNGHRYRAGQSEYRDAPLRTRASVKIQEGCSQPCTFCIVPQVRGAERSRPEDEISGLFRILKDRIDRDVPKLHKKNVKVRHLGRIGELPEWLQKSIKSAAELTGHNTGLTLSLAFNYGGHVEIVDATRRIVADGVPPEKIDEKLFSSYLYTAGLPDVDLLIRTADEVRLSNFLIWQTAYSEYYFTKVLWPDFGKKDIDQALLAYSQRERRFGALL